jgi:hypothetical protein
MIDATLEVIHESRTAALVVSLALLMIFGCGGDNPSGLTEDEVLDLAEEIGGTSGVKGSCNAIAAKSTCLDYFGSFWTEQQMRLNCTGPGVAFSLNGCPYSELGGCNTGVGTISDAVLWHYGRGAHAFSAEDAAAAERVCNMTPLSRWVKPEDKA